MIIKPILSALALSACLTNLSFADDKPDFIKSAESDISTAVIANIIKDPDFTCQGLKTNENIWLMGCFLRVKDPNPFLAFVVAPDDGKANPPFKYKLYAINGKAKQYAENPALRMFKIDTKNNIQTDLSMMREEFIKRFVK